MSVIEKAKRATEYLKGLSLLTQLRIAMGLPHGRKWLEDFAIRIPKASADELPFAGVTASNRLNERYYTMVMDRGPDGNADPVTFRLSQNLVLGLELGQLATSPSESSFLTMVQYLAVRQLLQNLSDIHEFRGDHQYSTPPIPTALASKLESLGVPTDLLQEQRLADAEPRFRLALLDSFRDVADGFPALVDKEFAAVLLKEFPQGTLPEELIEDFTLAESRILPKKLPEPLLETPQWISMLNEDDLCRALRPIVADKKIAAMLDRFVELITNGSLNMNPAAKDRILKSIPKRRAAILTEITDGTLRNWIHAAKERAAREVLDSRRSQLVENLFASAAELGERSASAKDGTLIDPVVLARTLAPKLEKLKARASVRDWLSQSVGAGSYLAARARYSELMAKATSPQVVVDGIVDPARVQLFLLGHDFSPNIDFPANVSQRMAEEITKRVKDGRKADIRNFLEIGKDMGFDRPYLGSVPRLRDVVQGGEKLESYFKALESELLTHYPVLTLEITVPSPGGKPATLKLFEYLNLINTQHQIGQSQIEQASVAVEQALVSVEAKIAADIERVANASSVEELETIVQSSLMLTHIMRSFSEFELQRQQELEKIMLPSLTHQLAHRVVSPYLMWGYGALMLIQVASAASKRIPYLGWATIALEEAGPLIHAYESSAVAALLAETSYSIYELGRLWDKKEDAQDLYQSSIDGGAFYSYSDTEVLDNEFSKQVWLMAGKLALESWLIYLPAYRNVAAKMTLKTFADDCEAFTKLGLKPADWKALDGAIASARTSLAQDASALADAERAYARLKGALKTGRSWSADIAEGDSVPRTMFEKKLIAARERMAKHGPKPAPEATP